MSKAPTNNTHNLPDTFSTLIENIRQTHDEWATQASKAINMGLTLRNWLMGYYITEYEQQGKDRADYGATLLATLSTELMRLNVPRSDERELRRYRQFYACYPNIRETLSPEFKSRLPQSTNSGVSVSRIEEAQTSQYAINGATLISKLSFSHIAELIAIQDFTKRSFYEMECIRGHWSVRELKRQINSLYYERSGLSQNKRALANLAQQGAEQQSTTLNIRDPYIFEFLGLKPAEVMSESHLEDQLTHKLQDFMLELGHGFCFEARQKRILIGNEHFFIDLVFYHRILKCHVLVELKLQAFNHENLGQLNTYVNWYRQHMMTPGDNSPIGLLLCTDKNHALAEYALAGMDNALFVSKYQLELPKKEDMQRFIDEQVKLIE